MAEQSFEKLQTWQKAHGLMLDVHKKLVPLLPKEEKYDLADQIRRSSKSVPANIVEGAGRYYYMDNVRFCYNARGSLDETLNHLIVARFGLLLSFFVRGIAQSNRRDSSLAQWICCMAEIEKNRRK